MKFYKRGAIFFCVDCGDIAGGFPLKEWVVIVKEFYSGDIADQDFKKQWMTAKEEGEKAEALGRLGGVGGMAGKPRGSILVLRSAGQCAFHVHGVREEVRRRTTPGRVGTRPRPAACTPPDSPQPRRRVLSRRMCVERFFPSRDDLCCMYTHNGTKSLSRHTQPFAYRCIGQTYRSVYFGLWPVLTEGTCFSFLDFF